MKRLVLLLLNLLMPMILFAASNDLCFRHFSVEDGLSSNSVRALMQDKYGFLWIGTDEGLNRYDGTTVKLYRLKDRGANEAISSLYSTLNKIWIGTDEGIYIYDYETEDIMPFVLATSKNIHIETNTNHIVEDKDKNLWFTTVGQGIFKYNTITNHLEQYEFKNANGLMASVLVDSENQIWAITNWGNSGLFKLNKAENKFETFPLSYESGKHDSNALVMLEDSEHTLWLGTWECGLQKIDKYSGKATTYLHPTDGKGATHIHSIMEYAPHQLLIGSDDGLLLFNTITEEYQLFTEDETNPHSLSNSRKVFNMQTTPWGGSAANPQFINSYDPDDMRLKYTWLQGEQYSPDGVLITTFPNKLPSIYKTDTDDGYRVGKYEIKVGAKSLLSNDFPYFRYTEVLLMKAECLLRLGQNEIEAAHLVSQIRERAFRESAHPEKATVDAAWLKGDTHINYGTLDEKGQIDDAGNTEVVELGGLYDEWGWEFAAEARRRTDMIRFGTYQKKSWFNHTPTANDLNGNSILFPIHLDHLNTNPNLQQNPGYAGK